MSYKVTNLDEADSDVEKNDDRDRSTFDPVLNAIAATNIRVRALAVWNDSLNKPVQLLSGDGIPILRIKMEGTNMLHPNYPERAVTQGDTTSPSGINQKMTIKGGLGSECQSGRAMRGLEYLDWLANGVPDVNRRQGM